MMKLARPVCWESPSLEELIAFAIGGDWGKDPDFEGEDFIEVLCIRGSEFRNWKRDRGTTASLRKIKKSSLESRQLVEGDILVEVSGGGPEQPVGRTILIDKVAISKNPETPKIPTNFLRLARPSKHLDSKYLNSFLEFFYVSGEINHYQGGSNNLRNLKFPDYLTIAIPLPPLAEQRRIVAKIEELFSELDTGEENILRARRQLGVYRQSLLKQAFEGNLTGPWRKKNPHLLESPDQLLLRIETERKARYLGQLKQWEANRMQGRKASKPKKPDPASAIPDEVMATLPQLPIGWLWCHLETVCEFANGDRGKNYPNRNEYVATGIPWINTGHIEPDGSLSSDRMHFITREKFERLSGGRIQPGDLVYCLRGATFGKTAFVRPYKEGAIASSLMIIRPVIAESCDLIYRFLLSPLGKSQLKRFDNGSAQPNLSADSVRLYEFPLCSLPEQQEIVRLLDEQFTVIEQNEREIDAALKRSAALRQSILKKAFTGQLVPQDPTDEPASTLLERIRSEGREASSKPTKSSRKRQQ